MHMALALTHRGSLKGARQLNEQLQRNTKAAGLEGARGVVGGHERGKQPRSGSGATSYRKRRLRRSPRDETPQSRDEQEETRFQPWQRAFVRRRKGVCAFLGTAGSLVELGREGQEGEHDGNCGCGPREAGLPRVLLAGQRVDLLSSGQFLTGGVSRSGLLLSEPHSAPNAIPALLSKGLWGHKGKGHRIGKTPNVCACKTRMQRKETTARGGRTHLLTNQQAPFTAVGCARRLAILSIDLFNSVFPQSWGPCPQHVIWFQN